MAKSVLQLQPEEQTLRKLTIAEYHKLVEAGVLHPKERVELLDGLLVQMAPIGPRHQSIVDQLTEEFSAQNNGRYKVSPGRPIPIPDFNEPPPDMVLFKRGVPSERRFWCKRLKRPVHCRNARDDGTDLGTRSLQRAAF